MIKSKKNHPSEKYLFPKMPSIEGIELGAINANISSEDKLDLMVAKLAPSSITCGVFTKSQTASAAVKWSKRNLEARPDKSLPIGLIVNSGNANVFTGRNGASVVADTAKTLAKELNSTVENIFIASTGVIGELLDIAKVQTNIAPLVKRLSKNSYKEAAEAIMTTDTFTKGVTRHLEINGQKITLNGIAKGSGMIAPNMATMLVFIFSDVNVSQEVLQKITESINKKTFNSITVDSDMSTSDMLLLFSTGNAKMSAINSLKDPRVDEFKQCLYEVMRDLAHLVVKDGEGAKKFIEINVTNAKTKRSAHKIAKSIAESPLVKTAFAGEDANWGRIVMAIGKSGQNFNQEDISIYFGDLLVAEKGSVVSNYKEDLVADYMKNDNLVVNVSIGQGKAKATVWTCDLTHEYISINADYRS